MLLTACGGKPTATQPTVHQTQQTTPAPTSPNLPETPTAKSTSAAIPTAAITVDPNKLQGVMLQFWHVWAGDPGEKLRQIVEKFNAENEYGIQVKENSLDNYNNLYDQVEAALTSGGLPNVAVGYNYQLMTWDEREGTIVNLGAYINDPKWGLSATEQADFYPVLWEQEVSQGRRVGVPFLGYGQVMYYNLSWAEDLGFKSAPSTPEDFQRQACAAALINNTDKIQENDGTGGWVVNATPSSILSWMYAFGSQVARSDGKGYQFNTPENEQAIAFLKELFDRGCAWQTESEYNENEFATRQALFMSASVSDLPYVAAAMQEAGNQDKWTVVAYPSTQAKATLDVYGPDLTIFESTPEGELASWLFIKWLLSPQNQADWSETNSAFPVRASALNFSNSYASNHPQWAEALKLLSFMKAEPAYASWNVVRWALGDVGTQTFRSYFSADRIPAMLDLLDETAQELHARYK